MFLALWSLRFNGLVGYMIHFLYLIMDSVCGICLIMKIHQIEDAAQEPMDRERAMAAGGEALVSGWLDSMLTDRLALADDETDEERAFKIAAAREALRQLAPKGASLAERMCRRC